MIQIRSRLINIRVSYCIIRKNIKYLELAQPFLALICLLLAEGEVNELPVAILCAGKGDHVLLHVAKVVARVRVLAGP